MIRFKKIAASVAALATALSLSVGTLAVTANEIKKDINKTFAEKAFVNSLYDDDCSTVAKYLLKSGISLDEVKTVMQLYVEGEKAEENEVKKMRKVSGTKGASNKPDFYSTMNCSYCDHYGVILSKKRKIKYDSFCYTLSYNDPNISLKPAESHTESLNNGVTDIFSSEWNIGKKALCIMASININSPSYKPVGICDFPIKVDENYRYITTEAGIHSAVTLEANDMNDDEGINLAKDYNFETYVIGDFDHNGKVDVRDLRRVANYISGLDDSILTEYNNFDANVAEKVNMLAADMNRDRDIDENDVTALTNYILTHPDSER